VVDVAAVPDGFEQAVGESEGQDVLRGLLPQEVVDPIDLFGSEDGVDGVVERLGRPEVGAEGLLHDDSGAWGQAGLTQRLDHGRGGGGRDAQIVESPALAAEQLFSSFNSHCQS
jgi:hypothetical protein